MSNELFPAGYHKLKIKAFGSKLVGEKNTPQAWVQFDNGLFWQGFFTDTVLKDGSTVAEKTVRQLVIMGFRGANVNELNTPTALKAGLDVDVSVVHETTDKGVKIAKVAWVNEPYKKKENTPEVTKVLEGIDCRAYVKTFSQELGQQPEMGADGKQVPW